MFSHSIIEQERWKHTALMKIKINDVPEGWTS